jgi:hypothetical protein
MESDEKHTESSTNAASYLVLFVFGITFMGMGPALMILLGPAMLALTGVGIIFLAIGLANRDKWMKSN